MSLRSPPFFFTMPANFRFRYLLFFNDRATTEIYTLSLHDALPIWRGAIFRKCRSSSSTTTPSPTTCPGPDRKSTRLNSSHANISYAVFCLKKKKHVINDPQTTDHAVLPRRHLPQTPTLRVPNPTGE